MPQGQRNWQVLGAFVEMTLGNSKLAPSLPVRRLRHRLTLGGAPVREARKSHSKNLEKSCLFVRLKRYAKHA